MAIDAAASGIISRSPEEIGRVLELLRARGVPVRAQLGDALAFTSRIAHLDPARAYFVLETGGDDAAERALLARPRASFRALAGSLHVEFAAAAPRRAKLGGRDAIRMSYPDVMATRQQRASERLPVQPQAPLHCLADAGGVISFDGHMTDISSGGIGFVHYGSGITLEPGTILRGCRIEVPGRAPVAVDLEVRYSVPTSLPDGRPALRSGCRFIEPTDEVKTLLAAYFRR